MKPLRKQCTRAPKMSICILAKEGGIRRISRIIRTHLTQVLTAEEDVGRRGYVCVRPSLNFKVSLRNPRRKLRVYGVRAY